MSHLKFENRKIISSMIAHGNKCIEIAITLGCDPTTISKEVKKNRIISKEPRYQYKNNFCRKLDKFPFVCSNCPHKYTDCVMVQMKYDAQVAQQKYDHRLHTSRQGIDMTKEDVDTLVTILKYGNTINRSVYASIISSGLDISPSTVYRYIEEEKIPFKKYDLPYASTYKKRKRKIKEYEYPNNKIDRNNRTFSDYLAYIKNHINEMTVQMDFLGSIKQDSKSILTLNIANLHFPFLFIIENKNAQKVVDVFDQIESLIGIKKFNEIIPSILTDRDPCFSDINGIETSKFTGEIRTNLFFCDAFKSNQKASVENLNKRIRKFFPKGKSIDHLTQKEIKQYNILLIEEPVRSLDGMPPKEIFIKIFGADTYKKIFID